jgi:hypothetical protein
MMADLMTALRNADAAGDTEAATRIAAMIQNQGGGQNAAPIGVPSAATNAQIQDSGNAILSTQFLNYQALNLGFLRLLTSPFRSLGVRL